MHRVELSAPEGIRWVPSLHSGDGVLVIAGSSGRVDDERARGFAEVGALAESIRWFGGPGQKRGPWEIPLETFLQRIDALRRDCDRVWMVGTSFGAEAALLCGTISEHLDGVMAFAPSDVVWAGYDGTRETSHWTFDGAPLPFMPVDWTGHAPEEPARFLPLYEQSLRTNSDTVPRASIPVERIRRLLLVAGGDDQVWPSLASAERIRSRRARNGLDTTLISSPDAGHRTLLPGESIVTAGMSMRRGGTESADRLLGARAWSAILSALESAR